MARKGLAVLAIAATMAGCSAAKPAAIDVQAARACHAFELFTAHKATGDDVLKETQPLVAGTAEAQAAGKPAPKWSDLGGNLLSAVAASNSGDDATLAEDANKGADECGTIPSAAKVAGGYTK